MAGNAGQEKVDGFYMTLNVQTPKSDGTRTVLPKDSTIAASAAESDVTSGTIYLVDANGNIVFKKPITESEWKAGKPTQGNDGSTQLKIAVEDVVAGATYKVYFLANAEDAKPWENVFSSKTKFANPYIENSKFAMFNQNDKSVDGNLYTVVFSDDNKKAGEKFMQENAKKPGVKTLPSGVQYKVIKEGTGALPKDTSMVTVNYEGRTIDGKVFDSSYKRNQPAEMRANQVIKGWTEALVRMPAGSVWEVYIPQNLAYGEREAGEIKPFSALIFKIELLKVK